MSENVRSEEALGRTWDRCISNTLIKFGKFYVFFIFLYVNSKELMTYYTGMDECENIKTTTARKITCK